MTNSWPATIGLLVLAVIFAVLAYLYWVGDIQFLTTTGKGVFYGYHDLIANTGIVLSRIAQHSYAKHFFGTAVVGYIEPGFLLYHLKELLALFT